jgi:chaperone modulatory protein CbpM
MNNEQDVRVGVIVDESVEFSLTELCRSYRVRSEVIIQLVEAGAFEARGPEPAHWRFSGPALRRIERALNLQRDLEINAAGVALALDLLDEIERLRERLRALEGGFG